MGKDLKVKEVATALDVKRPYVLALIRAGFLPAYDLNEGGLKPNYRVRQVDLETFKRSRMKALQGRQEHSSSI